MKDIQQRESRTSIAGLAPSLCAASLMFALSSGALWAGPMSSQPVGFPGSAPPDDTRAAMAEVDGLIAAGQLDEAAGRIQEVLGVFPKHPEFLIRAGHVYTAKRRFFVAEDYWAQLADMFPTNAWVQACWGGLLVRLERWDQAESVITNALQMNSSELVARYNMALIQAALKRPRKVRTVDELASGEIGRVSTWIRDETDVLEKILGTDGCSELCRAVLRGEPVLRWNAVAADRKETNSVAALRSQMDAVVRALWASVEAGRQKDWKAALTALQKAESLGVKAPTIYGEMALCRSRLGEVPQAKEELLKLLDQHPDSPLLHGLLGQICLESGDFAKAAEELGAAHKGFPFLTEIALNFAAALAASGKALDARAVVAEAYAASPQSVRAILQEDKPYLGVLQRDPQVTALVEPATQREP
ncbi:MAG: tetratricopeptide repeat protein [Verrucomicrobiota bacterium]